MTLTDMYMYPQWSICGLNIVSLDCMVMVKLI